MQFSYTASQARSGIRAFHQRNTTATATAPDSVRMNTPITTAHCTGERPAVHLLMPYEYAYTRHSRNYLFYSSSRL